MKLVIIFMESCYFIVFRCFFIMYICMLIDNRFVSKGRKINYLKNNNRKGIEDNEFIIYLR